MLKNVTPLRIKLLTPTPEKDLRTLIESKPFAECLPSEHKSSGFLPIKEDEFKAVEHVLYFVLRTDTKILPASVVNDAVKKRIEEIEKKENRRVGRKENNEIKESKVQELLPKAFSKTVTVPAWFDLDGEFLIIGGTGKQAENVISELFSAAKETGADLKTLFDISTINFKHNPQCSLVSWIVNDQDLGDLTVDDCAKFQSAEGGGVTVNNESVDNEEIRNIATTRLCTSLGVTYDNKVSFVIDVKKGLNLRRLSYLDTIESTTSQPENAEEQFAADLTIQSVLIRLVLEWLIEAFGGEEEKK